MLKVLQQVLSEVDRMLSTMLTFSNQLETPPQVYEMTLEGSIIGRICLVEKEFTLIRQLTKHNPKKSQPMLGLDSRCSARQVLTNELTRFIHSK